MARAEKLSALQATGLFDGVDEGLLISLADTAMFVDVSTQDIVVREGDPSASMFVVERGAFDVIIIDDEHEHQTVDAVGPGELIGEVQLITGGTRTATVRARAPGRLLELDRRAFDELLAENPEVLASIIEIINARLLNQQLCRAVSSALGPVGAQLASSIITAPQWVRVRRGEVLLEAAEHGDSAYLVVSGELLILSEEHADTVLGTIETGELVGELALLRPGARTATVVAARDSWLVRIGHSRFAAASASQPELSIHVAELVIDRLRARGISRPRRQTIAILPLSESVPIERLARDLEAAMERFGKCARLSASDATTMGLLRQPRQLEVDDPAWMRLSLWLQTERRDRAHVLLVGDRDDTGWNRRIISEADRIVLVADSRLGGELSAVDHLLSRLSREHAWDPQVWMFFVHPIEASAPKGSADWLRRRDVDQHVHLRIGRQDDLDRAARMLAGRAIGMALSGGGARGFAHVGVYQAWSEAGLPLDCIAGTSAGAFLGGLMATGISATELVQRVEQTFASRSHPFGDVTLPIIALIRGRRIKDLLHQIYGDAHIEDLWLPFAAVCTNLTRGVCEPRRRGLLWRALLASGSPPAVAPPVIIDGALYCDGGVTDNLPVSALDDDVCGHRAASHVGAAPTISVAGATEMPGPWLLAWDRLVRKGERNRGIPHIAELVMSAMTLGDAQRLAQARAHIDVFFEPPMSSFDMFDFSRPLEPIRASYHYARRFMADHEQVARIRTLVR